MGCGISKLEFEETGQVHQMRTIRRRNIIDDKLEDDNADNSFTSPLRKSVSLLTTDGGFLRRIIMGSLEKEKGVERDVLIDNNIINNNSSENNININHDVGLKSISSSAAAASAPPTMEESNTFCFKQPDLEEKESSRNELSSTKEENMSNPNDNDKNDDKEVEKEERVDGDQKDYIRPSNNIEASILFGPGSPSFRVYCVNDFIAGTYDEDKDDEEREEMKSTKDIVKGSDSIPLAKRGRRARGFRNAMHMGGSALGLRSVFVQRAASAVGRKSNSVVNVVCRSHHSTPSNDDTSKLIAKTAV